MQVGASTSYLPLLPVAVSDLRAVGERAAEQRRQQVQALESSTQQQSSQPQVERVRVRASAEAYKANNEAQQVFRDLPGRQRDALQSYLNNGPTIQERLGVDLAGIDVYA